MTDFTEVPLVALSAATVHAISTLLNPPKVIPCAGGLPRDWRGLAHLSGLSGEYMPLLTSHPDPSAHILTTLQEKSHDTKIKDLQGMLEKLDRWDIIDDTKVLFEQDAENYLEWTTKCQTSAEKIENNVDEQVLTVDDLYRSRQGLQSQNYDAFLLYADEDAAFATEIIENLEKKFQLKLCLKERDLVGGITFEHEAVMTLISERCNRLILVVSSNFFKSPANKFFLNYAQALSIEKRQRKIIPCLYEKCKLPPQLSYMFVLDYNRAGLYDFWGKLRDSVQSTKAPNLESAFISSGKEIVSASVKLSEQEQRIEKSDYQEKLLKELLTNDLEHSKSTINDFIHKDTAKCSVTENLSVPKPLEPRNKTSINILQWTKGKLIGKPKKENLNYRQISETLTIESLSSTESAEILSTPTETTSKKTKKKFITKCMKKAKKKAILES